MGKSQPMNGTSVMSIRLFMHGVFLISPDVGSLLKTHWDRATFRIFKIERKLHGREDLQFLERVFQKLLLNFTWWVNRKDQGGNNVFEGGFLGLDNIGAFNRSEPLPTGGVLRQADGTAWMAFFCLNM